MASTSVQELFWQTLSQRALSKDANLKAAFAKLDFSAATIIDYKFAGPISQGFVGAILGLFVDNSDNAASLFVTMGQTQQRLKIPPSAQGWFPINSMVPDEIRFESAGGVTIKVAFLNFRPEPMMWQANTGGGADSPLFVRDIYRSDMTVSNVVAGADAVAIAANVNRSQAMIVANPNNTGIIWVNFGTAAAADTGFPLPAGATLQMGEAGWTDARDVHIFGNGTDKAAVGYAN